jgi:spore photoproduct lyase
MTSFKPKQILVENSIHQSDECTKILKQYPSIVPKIIDNIQHEVSHFNQQKDAFYKGKTILLIAEHKGEIHKACPCSPNSISCGYELINLGINCPYNCHYCFLQDYVQNPFVTLYINFKDKLQTIITNLGNDNKMHRLGTGEFMDSLNLDHISGHSTTLINMVKPFPKLMLELKTKSTNIQNLLDNKAPENVVISWSVSPPSNAEVFEAGVPTIAQRLKAAKDVVNHGYHVSFHFDPIIYYPDFEPDYKQLIHDIYTEIDPKKIKWISLGSIRLAKVLYQTFLEKYNYHRGYGAETIVGEDQKIRYTREHRQKMYSFINQEIKKYHPGQFTYLCMENQLTWQKTIIDNNDDLDKLPETFNTSVFTSKSSK